MGVRRRSAKERKMWKKQNFEPLTTEKKNARFLNGAMAVRQKKEQGGSANGPRDNKKGGGGFSKTYLGKTGKTGHVIQWGGKKKATPRKGSGDSVEQGKGKNQREIGAPKGTT